MTSDKWGNLHSHAPASAVRALKSAIEQLAAYRGDPVGTIDAALKAHPEFVMGHAFRAGVFATASDKVFEPHLRKSLAAAKPHLEQANERERGHVAASQAWLDGDRTCDGALGPCRDRVSARSARHPTRSSRRFLPRPFDELARPRRARAAALGRDVPAHGFVLGMHAFGLEESGEYALAEKQGRKAVETNGQDGWAVHAVAHVMEMEGRARDGLEWLSTTASEWEPESLFAYHNVWHWTLFHLDHGDTRAALRLYDEKIGAGGFDQALKLVDGSALLWRLTVLEQDVGDRWRPVADEWAKRVGHGYYAFNDLHAMMAFVATAREELQSHLIATLERAAAGAGTNAMMTREVGLPGALGIRAFGRGDYAQALEHMLPLRTKAQLFGGSHAQRDVFSWTLVEAAIRAGDKRAAEALAAERLSWKPQSPLNLAWGKRAKHLV